MSSLRADAKLINFPRQAVFGRVLPKSKIYEHSGAKARLKDLFVTQVEQIVWQYKLAPETIKLPAKAGVQEIQVFSIHLKTSQLHEDVLRCIDRAVQFPILFEQNYDGQTQAKACYKRPSETDASKWVSSDYFASPWLAADAPREPMPMALDLASLYEQLLRRLIPLAPRAEEGLAALVERTNQMRGKQNEIDQTQARLNKERQFNHKVAINAELRLLKSELEELKQSQIAGSRN